MNELNWQAALPEGFPPETRIWIYQATRPFNREEVREITEQLDQFYTQWSSHNRPVKGWAGILFNQFVLFMADDATDRLCGTAVDNSIRLVKSLERQYQVSLLDRMCLAFLLDGQVSVLPVSQLPHALELGKVGEDTLYFNNTITTKVGLTNHWLGPVKDSWLAKRFHVGISS